MTHEPRPPHRAPTAPVPVDHGRHDRFLVASLLDPDLSAEVRARAQAQVAACSACAELLADLRAIAAATASLPVPPRRRDFRLSPEDARRLRPRGIRRLVAAFGAPRLAVLRPLGAAMATLGLAGLLLSATPLGPGLLGTGNAKAERNAAPAIGREPNTYELGGPNEGPGSFGPGAPSFVPSERGVDAQGGLDRAIAPTPGAGVELAVVLFAALLVIGLGLFALRLAAERTAGLRAPPG